VIGRATNRIAAWSVRTYALILHVYPCGFWRELGESMTQVFRDQVRDACKESGLVGLAALWMRTVVDVLVSVAGAYSSERRKSMFRVVVAAGILYVCTLVLVMGYGAIRFGEFYERPAFSGVGATEPVDEDKLIAAYERALSGEFGRYKTFAIGAGLVLAVLLGVASALFGLWQRSLLKSAGAFVAGAVLTIAAVSLLPTIWFPLDRYPVGFVWLLRCFPIAAGAWLLVTVIGRFGPARARFKPA
jgi:cytochrome b561